MKRVQERDFSGKTCCCYALRGFHLKKKCAHEISAKVLLGSSNNPHVPGLHEWGCVWREECQYDVPEIQVGMAGGIIQQQKNLFFLSPELSVPFI